MLAAVLLTLVQSPGGQVRPPPPYSELQWMIYRAAPESTVVVPRGSWPPIRINKPLTLVGEDGAVIYNDQAYRGDPFPAPITLDGPGYGTVTLANLATAGRVDGHGYSFVEGGVVGGGFETLEVLDCQIEAPSYWRWHLTCKGGPGIAVSVDHVLVMSSTVVASWSHDDFCGFAAGSAGIDAPRSFVEIYGSIVAGGSMEDPCSPLGYCPDSITMQSVTGAGVRASCMAGVATATAPVQWRQFTYTGPNQYNGFFVDCGFGPYGKEFEKTGDCSFVRRR